MYSESVDSESKVSGNQANIPARIRREFDIGDGDRLRWRIEDDGTLRVQVVQQRSGTFGTFEGYDGDRETDATTDHDAWGIDGEGMPRALVDASVLFAAAYRRESAHDDALRFSRHRHR